VSAFRAGPVARCWVARGLVLCALLAWPGTACAASKPPPQLDTVVIADLGPGYSVTTEGPLDASQFASNSPDPTAATTALATLAKTISTYVRVWSTSGGANEVQDLVVRFPSAIGAQVFQQAAQHSLDSGEIVSSGPLPGVPGAHRTTYFASTNQAGVGQAITMRAGVYVDLLSFFSAAAGNPQPITPADAVRVARAQRAAMAAAPGGSASLPPTSSRRRVTLGSLGFAALVVAVAALAVATPALLHRRRRRLEQVDATS
jgi:hypothetical protein